MNAKLDMIIGPMLSGKSCSLISRIRSLKVLEKPYLAIKPKLDQRYSNDSVIESHNFEKERCVMVDKLFEAIDIKSDKISYDTIFIDESQFFPDLKKFVLLMLEKYHINVVVAGLDGDFQRKQIGQVLDLIPYSDTCIKKQSLCKMCKNGTMASFTHRLTKGTEQIIIGACETYTPLCRKHYLELN